MIYLLKYFHKVYAEKCEKSINALLSDGDTGSFILMNNKYLLKNNKNILTFDYIGVILTVEKVKKRKDMNVNMTEKKEQTEDQENRENKKRQGIKLFLRKHPFPGAILLSITLGVSFSVLVWIGSIRMDYIRDYGFFDWIREFVAGVLEGAIIYGLFMIFPVLLVGAEIYLLAKGHKDPELYRKSRVFDIVGVVLGVFYSLFYLSLLDEVVFGADWQEQLINRQTHTPVYTGSQLTVIVIAAAAVIGYFVVNYISLKKMPPLTAVLGMAAMYLGTAESIIWGIQVVRDFWDFFLMLFPAHCVLLTARTVRYKMREWQEIKKEEVGKREIESISQEDGGIFAACNRFLGKAECWPVMAFVLMWPLLGILIGILLLFGQRPDAIIRAFTETSDWNLSQRVAPQNISYDEHYLCTVAAGGHEKVVKPKRLGVRHGHQVIVNRQLCVANAFEQVLEERTPGFHRAVRHFYDSYGFPVARLIHSKYTADFIYFLMKPLEWIFLIVLYLTDVNPENRIAIQYTGKNLADFERN